MSDGREERAEEEKRREQAAQERRDDALDRDAADDWETERVDS